MQRRTYSTISPFRNSDRQISLHQRFSMCRNFCILSTICSSGNLGSSQTFLTSKDHTQQPIYLLSQEAEHQKIAASLTTILFRTSFTHLHSSRVHSEPQRIQRASFGWPSSVHIYHPLVRSEYSKYSRVKALTPGRAGRLQASTAAV